MKKPSAYSITVIVVSFVGAFTIPQTEPADPPKDVRPVGTTSFTGDLFEGRPIPPEAAALFREIERMAELTRAASAKCGRLGP
jgi:hypothetical protein